MKIRNTTISMKLKDSEYAAHYDNACKQLLGEKQILARIMKATLYEYRHISVYDIVHKYIEGNPHVGTDPVLPNNKGPIIHGEDTVDKSVDEGTISYDLKFRALIPSTNEQTEMIINIEAQNDFYPGYPLVSRGIYYGSRMISSQYGTEFTHDEYGKLKKVTSIWICLDPPKHHKNTITQYSFTEKQLVGHVREPMHRYDLISVIVIGLGGPNTDNYSGLIKMLDVLLSDKIGYEEKRSILETEFEIKMTDTLDKELDNMCNLGQALEEKSRKKWMKEGLAQGFNQGFDQGMSQGMSQGIKKQTLSDIKRLMKNAAVPVQQAMDLLEVPKEIRKDYEKLIEQ